MEDIGGRGGLFYHRKSVMSWMRQRYLQKSSCIPKEAGAAHSLHAQEGTEQRRKETILLMTFELWNCLTLGAPHFLSLLVM